MKQDRTRFLNRQIALRRICLTGDGKLSREARLVAAYLKRFCKARGPGVAYSPTTGQVDPVATVAMAARREVYDALVTLLNLDDYTDVNLRENEG